MVRQTVLLRGVVAKQTVTLRSSWWRGEPSASWCNVMICYFIRNLMVLHVILGCINLTWFGLVVKNPLHSLVEKPLQCWSSG